MLAEYGSALRESGDAAAAEARLRAIWDNVELLAPSARASLTLFELGAGDALVTYESDARLAMARGVPLEIVLPSHTIVAQHVAVLVDANLTAAERPAAKAFIHYLLSEAGQASFTRYQLRPANLESPAFPALAGPFTIQEVGGWSRAYSEIIETLWQSEIEPRLDLEPAGRFLDDG